MFKEKKVVVAVFCVLIIIALAWFVVAVANQEVAKIISPSTGTNHSGGNSGAFVVNFTFQNGSAGVGIDIEGHVGLLNATIFYNITPTEWAIIGNTTSCVSWNGHPANISCYGPLNISRNITGAKIPDGKYKLNATILNGSVVAETNRLGISGSNNLSIIIIDNTEPSTAIFVGIASGGRNSTKNLGGNLTLNATLGKGIRVKLHGFDSNIFWSFL